MIQEIAGITFEAWQYWKFSLACIPLIGLICYKAYQLMFNVNQLAAFRWHYVLIPHYSTLKLCIKTLLLCIAVSLLGIALLQPTWGDKEENIEQVGRDLFIGLDISRSMLASDIKPHRLAFAKSKIRKLIKLLSAERVGLVVFSGDALVQCPLTRDTAAFNTFLDAVDVETISSGTTALDQALLKIISLFKSMPTVKDKIIVLFTDGEDFSTRLREVQQEAQKMNIHIFTYGVGTEQGAPVPVLDEQGNQIGHQKDEHGAVVISRLNQGILRNLSQESGGIYIAPTQDEQDLQTLVNVVEHYEKQLFDKQDIKHKKERYPLFLLGACICLLLELLL